MKTLTFIATALVFGADAAERVKISSFGYDPEDSTRFIQAALDSDHPKIILDRQAGPWYTLPLKGRSNKELVLEPGVELVAKRGAFLKRRDYLFELSYITNFTLRGGEGSAFRMWKEDYRKPPYEPGEWRYALRIIHSQNVLVEGLRFEKSGGDGIGICRSKNVTVRKCVCDGNHRQGLTLFSGENVLVEDTVKERRPRRAWTWNRTGRTNASSTACFATAFRREMSGAVSKSICRDSARRSLRRFRLSLRTAGRSATVRACWCPAVPARKAISRQGR